MYGIKLDSLFYQSYIIVIKRTYSLIFLALLRKQSNAVTFLTIIRAFRVLRPLRAVNKVPSKYIHKFLIVVDQWFNLLLRAS